MRDKTVTPEMIAKLPMWAQEHIKYLDMERAVALRSLNQHVDQQTPSKIYYEDLLCLGGNSGPECKRFYVQSERVVVESCGVQLQVYCSNGSSMHDPGIELQWSDPQRIGNMIAAVPRTYMQMSLIAHHNMRVRPVGATLCAHELAREDGHCLKCGYHPQAAGAKR